MSAGTVTDQANDTLRVAAQKMWEQQTGSLLVVAESSEHLVGIITERDILKAAAQGLDLDTARVHEVMGREPVTVHPSTSLRQAAQIMADRWIRHLPVVENGRLVGIVSQRDLTGVLAGALNEPEALAQLVEASELAREKRLKRIRPGAWD